MPDGGLDGLRLQDDHAARWRVEVEHPTTAGIAEGGFAQVIAHLPHQLANVDAATEEILR